jgi:hypothetical protein
LTAPVSLGVRVQKQPFGGCEGLPYFSPDAWEISSHD